MLHVVPLEGPFHRVVSLQVFSAVLTVMKIDLDLDFFGSVSLEKSRFSSAAYFSKT